MNNNYWENLIHSYTDKIKADFPIVERDNQNLKSFIQIKIPDDIDWERGQKQPLYRAVHKDSTGHTFYGQWLEDGHLANRELIIYQRGAANIQNEKFDRIEIPFKPEIAEQFETDLAYRAVFRYLKGPDAYAFEIESFEYGRWGLYDASLSLPSDTAEKFLADIKEHRLQLFSDCDIQFEYPTEGNVPLRRMKEMLQLGMSEFEAQRRNYNGKWNEWQSVKEEWLDLASGEDTLSDRAEWSIEACQKQIRNAAQQAINAGIDRAAANHSAKDIYAAFQPDLDPDGFYLLRAAVKVTGSNMFMVFSQEDIVSMGSGFGSLRYLEADRFGESNPYNNDPECEIQSYNIHSDTPQFKAYQDSTFTEVLSVMKESALRNCDIKHLISAAAKMQNIELTIGKAILTPLASPEDGLVFVDEHAYKYVVPYFDRQDVYEHYKRKEVPNGEKYRLHDKFVSPDCKVPDTFPTSKPLSPPQSKADQLLDVFTPARLAERLQSDLIILTDNVNTFRKHTAILDGSITEMKSEIVQMREHAVQANNEIKSGEPFNEWIRLNLKPGLSTLGLNPDTATMWDLTNKLEQLGPEAQTHAQTETLHLEEQAAL